MATVKIFNNYLRVPLAAFEMFVFAASIYGAAYISGWFSTSAADSIPDAFIKALPPDLSLISMSYAVIMILSMVALGHYKSHQYLPTGIITGTILRVFISLLLGSLVCILISVIFPELTIERKVHSFALILSFIGIIFIRLIFLQTIETKVLKPCWCRKK